MEETKMEKRKIISSSLVCIIPIMIGMLLWNELPNTIATHFAFDGTPDGFQSKTSTVLGIPSFLLLVHVFVLLMIKLDPKQKNQSPQMMKMIYWFSPLLSNVVMLGIYMVALEKEISIMFLVHILVAIIFTFTGNYLPKCKSNYTMGVRLPWTLNSEENWNYTHRYTGKIWFVFGLLMFLNAFLQMHWIFSVGLVVAIVTPFWLSITFYLKNKDAE